MAFAQMPEPLATASGWLTEIVSLSEVPHVA